MSAKKAVPVPIESINLFSARLVVTQYNPAMPELFDRCLEALSELASAAAMADLDTLQLLITRTYLPQAVGTARDYGTTWAEVGRQLSSSRQAAQQRFS
jgi:hypothetical protein